MGNLKARKHFIFKKLYHVGLFQDNVLQYTLINFSYCIYIYNNKTNKKIFWPQIQEKND